jgi:hypothetical protein
MIRKRLEDANKELLTPGNGRSGQPPAGADRGDDGRSPSNQPAGSNPPILGICTGGKWLDLYSPGQFDLQLINLPDLRGSEERAEKLIESVLTKRYRDCFFPGYLRQRFEVEQLSFADVRWRSWNQQLADALALSRAEGARQSGAQRILNAMGARR